MLLFQRIQQRGLCWQLLTRAGRDYTMMAKQKMLDAAKFPSWEHKFLHSSQDLWSCNLSSSVMWHVVSMAQVDSPTVAVAASVQTVLSTSTRCPVSGA